MVRVVAVPV
jgi:hypothetical protein